MKNYIRRDLVDKRGLVGKVHKKPLFSHSKYVVDEISKIVIETNAFSIKRKTCLKKKIAKKLECKSENLLISSDVCILLEGVYKLFLNPLDKVLIQVPSMCSYRDKADFFHAKVIDYELSRDFVTDYKSLREYVEVYSPKLLIIDDFDLKKGVKKLEKFLSKVDCPVIVDDRHGEFFDSKYKTLINKFKNLILIKSFYYANSSVSYIVADKELINAIKELGNCFNISDYDVTVCELVLDDLDYYKEKIEQLEKERDSFRKKLEKNESVSEVKGLYKNYFLFKCQDEGFIKSLEEKGMSLGHFGKNKRLKNYYILEVHIDDFN